MGLVALCEPLPRRPIIAKNAARILRLRASLLMPQRPLYLNVVSFQIVSLPFHKRGYFLPEHRPRMKIEAANGIYPDLMAGQQFGIVITFKKSSTSTPITPGHSHFYHQYSKHFRPHIHDTMRCHFPNARDTGTSALLKCLPHPFPRMFL